ncbi:hypothetical protein PROFUN_15034, partial [Planoprotostelium fungivorum]
MDRRGKTVSSVVLLPPDQGEMKWVRNIFGFRGNTTPIALNKMPPKSNNEDAVTATHVTGSSPYGCTQPATHGAHVTIGRGQTVNIIATCQTHNPPGANYTFRITQAAEGRRITVECCCFDNGRERACRCARGNVVCGCLNDERNPVCHYPRITNIPQLQLGGLVFMRLNYYLFIKLCHCAAIQNSYGVIHLVVTTSDTVRTLRSVNETAAWLHLKFFTRCEHSRKENNRIVSECLPHLTVFYTTIVQTVAFISFGSWNPSYEHHPSSHTHIS